MGIKNKKLAEGDLVTCKSRHRADRFLDFELAGPTVSKGSLGIIKFASDELIIVHWIELGKQGHMHPTDARHRLTKISRPKR